MQSTDNLQTIDDSGKAPETRVKDADSAIEICQTLYDGSEKRRSKWAKVDEMFDGFPPFRMLRAAGQAWRSNVNTMEGKAILSAATTPYYDLFRSSSTYATIQLDLKDSMRNEDVSRWVTLAFHEMLEEWQNFHFMIWPMLNEYVRHGEGFQMWGTDGDWRPRFIRHHRVFVPDETDIDLDELDMTVIHQDVTVSMLWKKIRNTGAARAAGWNRDAVIDAIRNACSRQRTTSDDPIDVVDAMRDNDLYMDTHSDKVQLAHLFVKEFRGSFTHMIIVRNHLNEGHGRKSPEFLYKRHNVYKRADQFICPFFFEVMNGSWNGASGLGKDIHPPIHFLF